MNKFIIALVFTLLFASSFAFKAKSKVQASTSAPKSAVYGYPVSSTERPHGYTHYEDEEYFEDCPATFSKSINSYASPLFDSLQIVHSDINHFCNRRSQRIRRTMLRQR